MFEILENCFKEYCDTLSNIYDSTKWDIGYLEGYMIGYEHAMEDISQTQVQPKPFIDPADSFF